ncbi:MAG: helix-turn-helix transcriptional regulator [Bacteroidetes bacterium]|nr:helix-turn-helix transcriptional regulator [Bacteroidota bacterium]
MSTIKGRIFVSCKREKHYSRELMLDQHALVYVYAGDLEISYADQSHHFKTGQTVVIPRHQLARLMKVPVDGEPFRSVSIVFPTEMLHRFYSSKPPNPAEERWKGHMEVGPHPLLENFFQSLVPYFDLQDELPPDLAEIKINECLTLLDAYAPKARRILAALQEPGKIDLAEFMERNFMFNLPLEKFGYLTGRSLTTFKKDFKHIFQTTPGRWLTRKRLERAHYQIAIQKRKPSDVYLDAGFENLAHFSYAFKKQYGYNATQTPNQPGPTAPLP